VERWAEDSGNAALMGRELPPDEVLAADERITAWAGELKKAGLDGGMDELRARAHLDLLLGKDSRPRQDGAEPAAQPPVPSGFAGRVTLTVPLATLTNLADRPGELCNGGPKCRHDHRLKQHPKWKVDQLPDGTFRWTTQSGRTYTTEPTRYPI
jgi:hypothetical protein